MTESAEQSSGQVSMVTHATISSGVQAVTSGSESSLMLERAPASEYARLQVDVCMRIWANKAGVT
ncbi:hypothetical protein PHLCEN_2v7908 [Hermanssonia centrifuga]|uniref:Uncharacterized protein n=1 Tax=Hermanssonia centrifuga TaxID=98765 RepID=A0A2R6NVD3_9APHY|nr:hypothetical protein PHLCEN_2v7908 [Hermanssonia centrifuga]